jgi:acetyltransferase-like isoleucine patch superfamily enzyme
VDTVGVVDYSAAERVRRVDFRPWEYDPASPEGKAQAALQLELTDGGARIGDGVFIAPNASVTCERLDIGDRSYIAALAYVSGEVTIGADCTVNPYCVVRGDIRMGDAVRIGSHTSILGFNHNMALTDRPIYEQGLSSKGITIGDDVWSGSYAQFGLPPPHPEATIDTVLEHAADPLLGTPEGLTACNILDTIHPLWLAAKQTEHRRPEGAAWAQAQLQRALQNWKDGQGLAFAPLSEGPDGVAGLQGTEMWLSIIWLLADYLGVADALGYRPRGVHNPDPLVRLPPIGTP